MLTLFKCGRSYCERPLLSFKQKRNYYVNPLLSATLGRKARIGDPLVREIVSTYLEELKANQKCPPEVIHFYTYLLRQCDRRNYKITDRRLQQFNVDLIDFAFVCFMAPCAVAPECIFMTMLLPEAFVPLAAVTCATLSIAATACLIHVMFGRIFRRRKGIVRGVENAVLYSKQKDSHLQRIREEYKE